MPKYKVHKFKDEGHFVKVSMRLADDVLAASVQRRLRKRLDEEMEEFLIEFNQSPAFWSTVFGSLTASSLAALCRVYDSHPDALSLGNWLRSLPENAASLPGAANIKHSDLEESIKSVTDSDPIVKRLIQTRGAFVAHRNARNVIEERNLESRFGVTFEELDLLVDRALDTLNRYGQLVAGQMWSRDLVGSDDYKYVLKAIRESREIHDREIDAEIQQAHSERKSVIEKGE